MEQKLTTMPGKVSGVATVIRKEDKETTRLLIWRDKDGNLHEKRTK